MLAASPRLQRRQPRDLPDQLPGDLHPVLRRIYLARGIHRSEQLDLSLQRMLRPDQLSGIEAAARRLAQAVTAGERILVVGDFDADGATGTALALSCLRAMGAEWVDYCVPNRFEFGYGLTEGLVAALPEPLPELLITVDNGISSIPGVAAAHARGIPVMVTDHHLPGDTLPEADWIVNPNLDGDGFPSKSLAGVGVMFYLMLALRRHLQEDGHFGERPAPNLGRFLDLVSLGTVADLVPLDDNNRILVARGLDCIRSGRCRPGIQALLHVAKRHFAEADAGDLGFAVGPRLNAAGRLDDMSVGIECLLSEDIDQALALATQLNDLNQERQALQGDMQEQALAVVREQAARLAHQESLPLGLVLFDAGWHQGIVGLVASRVKDTVHRPAVVFAPESEGSAMLKGSARSIRGVHLRDVLARVDALQPGLMAGFGGHAMAAGLSLHKDHLEAFGQRFQQALAEQVSEEQLQAVVESDGELGAGELSLEFAELLREAGPWGQRCPEPQFDGHFEVLQKRVVGERHLKMTLRPATGGEPIEAIAFGTSPDDLAEGRDHQHLVYRLVVNTWRGVSKPELMIEQIL